MVTPQTRWPEAALGNITVESTEEESDSADDTADPQTRGELREDNARNGGYPKSEEAAWVDRTWEPMSRVESENNLHVEDIEKRKVRLQHTSKGGRTNLEPRQ